MASSGILVLGQILNSSTACVYLVQCYINTAIAHAHMLQVNRGTVTDRLWAKRKLTVTLQIVAEACAVLCLSRR